MIYDPKFPLILLKFMEDFHTGFILLKDELFPTVSLMK